jgi:hypothetical protein
MSQKNIAEDKTELRLDESNELFFKISIQGAEKRPETIRLVCEVGDVSYLFKGKATGDHDVVCFVVPPMKNSVKSGQLCEARVEVIVDDHYFVPVKFNAEFKEPVKVVAESVAPIVKKTEPTVVVQAKPMTKTQYASLREKYQLAKK